MGAKKKTKRMISLWQGKAHIDRRIWIDTADGYEVVSINGWWCPLDWCCMHYDDIEIWEG